MIIKRDEYLDKLISLKHNGMIKIITGLRRSGKSFLLSELFFMHLKSQGILNENIIYLSFDDDENSKLLDSKELSRYLKSKIKNDQMYYFLLDEIQLVEGFEFVLISLMKIKNVDIYITGSNSRFLSTDIITEFRGRGFPIHIWPLSFSEIYNFYKENKINYPEILTEGIVDKNKIYSLINDYGSLPQVVIEKNISRKKEIIKNIFENVYINDVTERYKIESKSILKSILKVLALNIGNILNLNKLLNILHSNQIKITYETLDRYVTLLENAFLIYKVERLDYKNSKIVEGKNKIYFCDLGIRNYLLNYQKDDYGFVLENILSNEFSTRNLDLNVMQINTTIIENNKQVRKSYEIDFVFNSSGKKYYIQLCYSMEEKETYDRELRPLLLIKDFFKKMIVTKSSQYNGINEKGVENINLFNILLEMKKYIEFDE